MHFSVQQAFTSAFELAHSSVAHFVVNEQAIWDTASMIVWFENSDKKIIIAI